ncbi:hypothetical protein CL620_05245 [archaeon]|jgi:hypothetical protein|nr:hypothetical protein [archaeon]|tara:strand:- start:2932 stop:4413 length:1482 start_codon:yes stop_codon:yes gene_type:complete
MMTKLNEQDQQAFDIVRKLFKNDYAKPFEMTEGQISLFRAIYEKQSPRNIFECYTQYGKSDVVSMAVLLRATTFPERWPILGGTKDKAGIIMNKVIKHIFENDYTLGKFEIGPEESMEFIKRHRSKDKISFKVDGSGNMGEVFILSADARRKGEDAGDILIGHGAPNLIQDDSALIPDAIHGKAMRMLGGHTENFLLKITNSFGRNHAFRSLNDPKYKKIIINWEQGVKEGRITEDFVEEMRGEVDPIMFGILYECVHPPEDMIDDAGWMPLFTEEMLEQAQQRKVEAKGFKRLGGDIAEGVNYNAFVLRFDNFAKIHSKNRERDLMKTADNIAEIHRGEKIKSQNIFIDAISIGSGVVSRLHQMDIPATGVRVGEKPMEQKVINPGVQEVLEFSNLRAQLYWLARNWVKQGGALEPDKDWSQLLKIRYKEDQSKKIKIMPKDEMRRNGLLLPSESTDVPDAFVLTFFKGKEVDLSKVKATGSIKPYYPELGI